MEEKAQLFSSSFKFKKKNGDMFSREVNKTMTEECTQNLSQHSTTAFVKFIP